jgi:hypothetical protein
MAFLMVMYYSVEFINMREAFSPSLEMLRFE